MENPTLAPLEDYLYRQFESEHKIHCDSDVELIVTKTTIGIIVEVACKKCGERIDITDYDCW